MITYSLLALYHGPNMSVPLWFPMNSAVMQLTGVLKDIYNKLSIEFHCKIQVQRLLGIRGEDDGVAQQGIGLHLQNCEPAG